MRKLLIWEVTLTALIEAVYAITLFHWGNQEFATGSVLAVVLAVILFGQAANISMHWPVRTLDMIMMSMCPILIATLSVTHGRYVVVWTFIAAVIGLLAMGTVDIGVRFRWKFLSLGLEGIVVYFSLAYLPRLM